MKILILGGYGTFGSRLAELLAGDEHLTLVIAGRSHARAETFCATLNSKGSMAPAVFDRDGNVKRQLAELAPDIVVDASGPFQAYGVEPYRVVKAALARGLHYLDLADGSDFVAGIAQFDADARSRGVFVLSGVSSFPLLTAAVVRRLAAGMTRLNTVSAGIAPSPHANVGLNVVRANAAIPGSQCQ